MKKFYIKSLKHKYIYLITSIFFGIFLLYISTLPHSKIENSFYPQISDLFDMINHFIGFSLFNFLLLSSFLGIFNRKMKAKVIILYFSLGVFWGLTCEVSQYFISSRSFQYIDIIANTSPSIIVLLLVMQLMKNLIASNPLPEK
ncbi:hypothetical protein ES703_19834 [subsurface metagenome]